MIISNFLYHVNYLRIKKGIDTSEQYKINTTKSLILAQDER